MGTNSDCKFCKFDQDNANVMPYDELSYSETVLASGCWVGLYKRVFKDETMVLFGAAEDYTDYYYPKFCPECGRRINLKYRPCETTDEVSQ